LTAESYSRYSWRKEKLVPLTLSSMACTPVVGFTYTARKSFSITTGGGGGGGGSCEASPSASMAAPPIIARCPATSEAVSAVVALRPHRYAATQR
jgi:hypothetical protein